MTNPFTRRLVTVTVVYVSLVVLTTSLPIVLPLAAVIDLTRWVRAKRPAMTLRIIVFGWTYLFGEAMAVLAMAIVWFWGRRRSITATYWLQRVWLDWNFDMLRIAFSLTFRVEGRDQIAPAPFLLLSRHASLIDTMLPGRYVVKPHGYRLRYVLKRELLVDPALDIGGNRLPNYFIDRKGTAAEELEGLRLLATDLGYRDAVLIYPEGTRYSNTKRAKYVERSTRSGGAATEIVRSYRRVLPPRPGGTLALLEASEADVVVLNHRGLEGFASVRDMWDGGLVGSTVHVRFWRIPRSQIPQDRDERVEWLYRTWAEVDRWITTDS